MYRVTIVSIVQIELNSNAQLPFSAVILSARLSARVRTPDMERIINFIKKVKNVFLA